MENSARLSVPIPARERPDADRQRVARAKRGEAAAFEELIVLHAPPLHRMLTRVLGNAADAEEVAQEAFLRAWRGLDRFRGDARFSTWLYRIAMNEASRHLAHDARRLTLPLDDVRDEIPDLRDGPAAQVEAAELQAHLERCVADLPANYRTAVVLRDIEGLTNEEAAEVLGLELANFKSRLHRGRMAIRRSVENFYVAAAASGHPGG
jgi:RNA polymerase sigma-70 factor, ECF subfamily